MWIDEIALPMLEYLNQLQAISLAGVLSQPDRPSGESNLKLIQLNNGQWQIIWMSGPLKVNTV